MDRRVPESDSSTLSVRHRSHNQKEGRLREAFPLFFYNSAQRR